MPRFSRADEYMRAVQLKLPFYRIDIIGENVEDDVWMPLTQSRHGPVIIVRVQDAEILFEGRVPDKVSSAKMHRGRGAGIYSLFHFNHRRKRWVSKGEMKAKQICHWREKLFRLKHAFEIGVVWLFPKFRIEPKRRRNVMIRRFAEAGGVMREMRTACEAHAPTLDPR